MMRPMDDDDVIAPMSVKLAQKAAIVSMLRFNEGEDEEADIGGGGGGGEAAPTSWKVLVYDQRCSDILSPVLRVGDLRREGVTLHLLLHRDRQPIPDVPVVYFVGATKEAVQQICDDVEGRLYDGCYVNFASSLPASLMDEMASRLAPSPALDRVLKVADQHVDFVSLEHDLFVLNQRDSFVSFHDASVSEEDALRHVEQVAQSLYSVCLSLRVLPIIRSERTGAAAIIATRLHELLHSFVLGGSFASLAAGSAASSSGGGASSSSPAAAASSSAGPVYDRPVLIITDRSVDISVMMQHPWTYQAMLHDLMKSSLNRVRVSEQDSGSSAASDSPADSKVFSYDLDSDFDSFWNAYRGQQFPVAASAVHEQLEEYKRVKEEFKKLGITEVDGTEDLSKQLAQKTAGLRSFASSLPELQQKKRMIDQHLNTLTALLGSIQRRSLNTLVELEELLVTDLRLGVCGVPEAQRHLERFFQKLEEAPEGGCSLEDRVRLYFLFFLCSGGHSVPALEAALGLQPSGEEADAAAAASKDAQREGFRLAMDFLRENRLFPVDCRSAAAASSSAAAASRKKAGKAASSGFMSMLTDTTNRGWKDVMGLVQGGMSQVNSMLRQKDKKLCLTRIVEGIMANAESSYNSSFLYFDPKHGERPPRKSTNYGTAIVFAVGGGNYIEYQNLQDYAAGEGKTIVYGATELLDADGFLQQLRKLGQK